jgi:hypothetical protein
MEGEERLNRWIGKLAGKKLLVMDIGSGLSTPTWVRWPCERLTRLTPGGRLVRINLDYPEVPPDLRNRSLSFQAKASEVLGLLPNPNQRA